VTKDQVLTWLKSTAADYVEDGEFSRHLFAAAALIEAAPEPSVALDYKLPCEVRLPISMSIGKGCPLSTLMTAFRQRESWSNEDTHFQDDRGKAVRRALGIPHGCSGEFATYVGAPVSETPAPMPYQNPLCNCEGCRAVRASLNRPAGTK
jgi:hypothetical protein